MARAISGPHPPGTVHTPFSTPGPADRAGTGRHTRRPGCPLVTEALQLLPVTARQALSQASQRADRQAREGRVVERVRALPAPRMAPGGPVLCACFTTALGDRVTWGPDFTVVPAGEAPRDLRYLQTTAAPVPAGHTEPGSDPALVEALNELAAIDNPADDEVLCVHLGSNTVTRLTSHTLGAATPGPPLCGGCPACSTGGCRARDLCDVPAPLSWHTAPASLCPEQPTHIHRHLCRSEPVAGYLAARSVWWRPGNRRSANSPQCGDGSPAPRRVAGHPGVFAFRSAGYARLQRTALQPTPQEGLLWHAHRDRCPLWAPAPPPRLQRPGRIPGGS